MDDTHNPFLGEEGDPLLKKREEAMQVGAGPRGWGAGGVLEGTSSPDLLQYVLWV